jgi:hypothetical protein
MAYTTINKSTDYFNTKLYAGNNGTNAITGVGFQPDFNWIKDRTSTGEHLLVDVIRGMNNLRSNSTTAESANGSIHQQSLDSDGFTVAGSAGNSNASGRNYASWNWKANGAGSANTDGSISSTVSVNTTSGFSIVKYTGTGSNATVGHGLGVAPKMIHVKGIDVGTTNWLTGGSNISSDWTTSLHLNTTGGPDTYNYWQNQAPNTNTFALSTDGANNQSGVNFIAYCFAEVPGYSKFGSYTGNGADGSSTNNFIYTGFKPTWVMVKRSNDSGQQWTICDTTRSPSNVSGSMEWLFADSSGVETDEDLPYMLSNGFMPRTGHTYMNRNGFSYIYMAFGQSLVGSNNVPCTAR